MRLLYLDPPYVGQAERHYGHDEVCHEELADLAADFDGYVLHLSVPSLPEIWPHFSDGRLHAWVKPFAAFKRNVPVAYAWEPVIIKAVRKPVVGGLVKPLRDFISKSITLKRGLTGAKPEAVCWWAFECAGLLPADEIVDWFPGTNAVTKAWSTWREQRERVEVLP